MINHNHNNITIVHVASVPGLVPDGEVYIFVLKQSGILLFCVLTLDL